MPPRPTTRASTRKAEPKPSMKGPSCTSRMSATRPRRAPAASTTAAPSTSLISIVAAPRDVAHDVVADPVLGGGAGEVGLLDAERHGAADVADSRDGDAARVTLIGT